MLLLHPLGAFSLASDIPSFRDLEGHWAAQAVYALERAGAIQGFPDGSFRPEDPLLLGQLLKMLFLAAGQAVPSPAPGSEWVVPFMAEGRKKGWLLTEDALAGDSVTRGDLAQICCRAFYPRMSIESEPSFPDAEGAADPQAVEFLHQLGILQGEPDGLYHPEETVTRAQGCTTLARLMGREVISKEILTPFGSLQLSARPGRVLSGGHLEVRVNTPSGFTGILLWGDQEIFITGNLALIPVAIDEENGMRELSLLTSSLASSYRLDLKVVIVSDVVPTETIELPPEAQQTMEDASLLWERKRIEEALTYTSSAIPSLPFVQPVPGPILDTFGVLRTYVNVGEGRHWGVDLSAEMGEAVEAASDGVVLLAEMLSSRGNTVVIGHGGGLFSLYCHLSAFRVEAGDRVTKGQTIAEAGSTGASTGPHLHWEVRLGSIPINPLSFLVGTS
jgi:hypothetical protein